MEAWVVESTGEPDAVLQRREVEVPRPPAGFLRLRVDAAAIGLPDLLMCRGTYPLTPAGSFTPGQEVVGVVTAVGDDVDPALVGTRRLGVTAFYLGQGGFAREALAAATTTFAAPDWLSDDDAAAFHIPFTTAWIGLVDRGGLAAGEHLVVLGAAGSSGAAAVQLGHALGAYVIAVAGGPTKTAYCASIGADVVIDHQADDVGAAIAEVTEGRGPDLVFDPVGGSTAEAVARTLASRGRHLLVGFASGSWAELDPALVVQRNISTVGVYAGAYDHEENQGFHDALLPLLETGTMTGLVTEQVDFEALPAALQSLSDRTAVGRQVLLPSAPGTAG